MAHQPVFLPGRLSVAQIELSIRQRRGTAAIAATRKSCVLHFGHAWRGKKAKLEELKFLVSSIGPTGLLALKPFLRMSRKDF
jgi:hypothetical protein